MSKTGLAHKITDSPKILDPHFETGLIGTAGLVTDGSPVCGEHVTSSPLRDTVAGLHVADQLTGPIRLYNFRLTMSCSISLSRLRFATRRLSRVLSSSSCFSRFISDGISPPYLLRHR